MQEVVLERIEKDAVEKQWEEYHDAKRESGQAISPRQRAYIVALAREAGLSVDASQVKSREEASHLIERLKAMNGSTNGKSFDPELRDKRVAFGMATKLVFKKYMDRHKEVRRSKKFWHEVEEFYREYQKQQESVVRSPSSSQGSANGEAPQDS